MTAAEAKLESAWRSLPSVVRVKIERPIDLGEFFTYMYKSVTPDTFRDIDTTLMKLQLLGYIIEYGKVNIEDDPNACGITTDTKLTIKW